VTLRWSDITTKPYVLILALSSVFGGCSTDPTPEWSRDYVKTLQESTQLVSELGSVQAVNRSVFRRIHDHPDLILALPSTKKRRYSISSGPTLNVRSFWDMGSCEIARLVAYRNSPLGRSMLPSQHFIYDARFIYSAPRCDTKDSGKESVKIAVEAKLKSWSQRWWNAVWGGRELGRYLSRSWPRGRALRKVDAQDESTFAWLAQLDPRDAPEIRAQFEQRIGSLPKYVGGKIIDEAAEVIYILRESDVMLRRLDQRLRSLELKSSQHSSISKRLCEHLTQAKSSYIKFQSLVSLRYQALLALSKALAPITLRLSAPTPNAQNFITWWLGGLQGAKASALKELRKLSRFHVQMWGERGVLRVCRAPALHE
jgi:hypothetical protein